MMKSLRRLIKDSSVQDEELDETVVEEEDEGEPLAGLFVDISEDIIEEVEEDTE